MSVYIKQGYIPKQDIYQTEIAIKRIKDYFEDTLAGKLSLIRVSAPLFVLPESGLNDNLNGVERPVVFDISDMNGYNCEIVHSLAKWKRHALKRYGCKVGAGIYTDMNAIRRDEHMDNLHSIYVDQWDWELCINEADRNMDFLRKIVQRVYAAVYETERYVNSLYPGMFTDKLPERVHFITSQELLDAYPNLSAKQREDAITKLYRAVFVAQIGATLSNAERHDGRAPDYDDWGLNGDLLIYCDTLDAAMEISSMGIRVDADSLLMQLKAVGNLDRLETPFHRELLAGNLPFTVGGGIGQSRLCMFYLEKLHIGEVHASVWPEEDARRCADAGINLL